GRIGEAELQVELVQVVSDVGIIIRIDDRDRGATSVAGHRAVIEANLIETVSMPNLGGRVAARARIAERCRAVPIRPADVVRLNRRKNLAGFENLQIKYRAPFWPMQSRPGHKMRTTPGSVSQTH